MTSKLTVEAYLTEWLDHISNTRRYKTFALYEGLIRKHVTPDIGGLRLVCLKRRHIRSLLDDLSGAVGARTRQLVHRVLRQALAEAIEDELIAVNPCFRRDKPSYECGDRRALSIKEVQRLLAAAKRGDYYLLFYLALVTGMRQGEIFGLRWDAIDFDSSSLYVRASLTRDRDNKPILSPPKSSRKRRIDLGDRLQQLFTRHKRRQSGGPWVFTDINGEPLEKDRFVRGVFHPLLKEAGIDRIRFHDLRHTSATLALASGINVKIVSERLGHSSSKMTLDVYTRTMPTLQKEGALADGKLDRLICGRTKRASVHLRNS